MHALTRISTLNLDERAALRDVLWRARYRRLGRIMPVTQPLLVEEVVQSVPAPRPPGARIGVNAQTGEPVYIDAPDLEGGMAIIGRPRKGKTVTMLHMAEHYVAEGHMVIVIDPHEDFVNDLLLRLPESCIDNIAVLDATDDAYPFGINPFHCRDAEDDELIARQGDQVHEVFRKVSGDAWGAVLDDIIPNAAYTLLYNPGYSILELARLLTDAEFRARLVGNVRNLQVRQAWEDEFDRKSDAAQRNLIQSTIVRIRKFTRNPLLQNILGQSTPTVDWAQLIREQKSILLKLSIRKLGRENTALLGGLALQQIMAAALEQLTVARSERRQIILFCDEFQLFATETFAEIIEQLGKVGLTVVLAHQNLGQINRDVLRAPRNATSHISFQIGNKDAAEKVEEYDASPPAVERVIHPDPLSYILRNGHRDARVVAVLKSLVQSLDTEVVRLQMRAPYRNSGPYLAQVRGEAAALTNVSSNYLAAAQTTTDEASAAGRYRELKRAAEAFFSESAGRIELFVGGMTAVGHQLAEPQNHVYSTSSQFDDTISLGQAKERLRRTLTRLPRLHAYAKLQVNGEAVEMPVVIDPPPSVERTPETERKLQRIRELGIERGYVRPRADVEREIEMRYRTSATREMNDKRERGTFEIVEDTEE